MRRLEPRHLLAPTMAMVGVAAMTWLGLFSFAWNDYENEALPAMNALVHGHFAGFAALAPSYGGSLLLRAPFAFLATLLGGGQLAVYQAISIPCLLGGALLGLWLCARMRREGHSRLARGLALGLCVANPLTLRALELGHPEELLDGCMCIAAVLLAASAGAGNTTSRRIAPDPHALGAGLLLGLAIGSKESAVIALGPALLALPRRHWQLLGAAAISTFALLAPIALLSSSFISATGATASTASVIFQPWQIFWFLGKHGALVHGLFGAPKPGYRIAPGWVGPISHPLVVLAGIFVPGALWLRRRSRIAGADALGLLALLMLLRCLLDTWDNVYYTVPLLISLLAFEVSAYRRPPILALSATMLCWASFQWLPQQSTPDVASAFFIAWTAPLAAFLAMRLFAPSLSLSRRLSIVARPVQNAPLAGS